MDVAKSVDAADFDIGVPTGKSVVQNRPNSGNATGLRAQANPEPSKARVTGFEGVETRRVAPKAERMTLSDGEGIVQTTNAQRVPQRVSSAAAAKVEVV